MGCLFGERDPDQVGDASVGFAQRVHLGHDEPDQGAVAFQHGDLPDVRALRIDRLHRLGRDVLAVGQDDHLLRPPGDPEIAVGVQVPDVAGAEPAVLGEGFGVGLGAVGVAGKDARALEPDFAVARAGVALGGKHAGVDVDGHARRGQTGAADAVSPGRVEGGDGGGLHQAVAGQDLPAEALERARRVRIQARAARGQGLQLRRQTGVERLE